MAREGVRFLSRYSREQLLFILINYWTLKEGKIPSDPQNIMPPRSNRSPFEAAICMVSDIDTALSNLNKYKPKHWLKISRVITEHWLRIYLSTNPDTGKITWSMGLNAKQVAVIKCYLLDVDSETRRAEDSLNQMLRILNQS